LNLSSRDCRSTSVTDQQLPRIGILIGSTREGRFGEKPAH
jgi:hypothetical protein